MLSTEGMAARPTAARIGRGIYSVLVAFPVACFTLALVTDILYWRMVNLMWLEFSAWLLLAGVVAGAAAAPFAAMEFFGDRKLRANASAWVHVAGRVIVLLLALINNLVHAADGWTAVMPWGLTLSALTVLVMLLVTWLGASPFHAVGGYRNV